MLMIPVPFVVSLMLLLLAVTLYLRLAEQAKSACLFLVLCAATTAVVGLRWTVDWPALRMTQPILASLIPVAAWCTFTRTHEKGLSRLTIGKTSNGLKISPVGCCCFLH